MFSVSIHFECIFFFTSRRRHTRCALVTGVQTCALPIFRKIEARGITAGIDVTGRASAPQAEVWTDPATNSSDALSYLALGRPTSNLSSDESDQLNAATAALNAGGRLLAGQLGRKIGLDDHGGTEARAPGGSGLGGGTQTTPRLHPGA